MIHYQVEHHIFPFSHVLEEIDRFQKEMLYHPSLNQSYAENYRTGSGHSIVEMAQGVLKNGGITLLKDDHRIVGFSAYYHWNNFTIGGVRFLNSPIAATSSFPQIRLALPLQIEEAKKNNSKAFCVAINSNNTKMFEFFDWKYRKIKAHCKESEAKQLAMTAVAQYKLYDQEVHFNHCAQRIFYIPLISDFFVNELAVFQNGISLA